METRETILDNRGKFTGAAPAIPWDQRQADTLLAGIRLARGDADPASGTHEDAIDAAWVARDLPGLWKAVSAWFVAAQLDIRWYVGPVLSDWEKAWCEGRVETWPVKATEGVMPTVPQPLAAQTEMF